MKLYAYEVDRRKTYSIGEQGTGYILSTEPREDIHTSHYEIDFLLLGTIEIYDAIEHEGELLSFQIVKDGETYKTPILTSAWEVYRNINEIFRKTPLFSVAETATMLQLSGQRIRALIENKQLKAQKRSGVWFLSGLDILAFSLLERPAHRPSKLNKEAGE
jgi:hypothetical protein